MRTDSGMNDTLNLGFMHYTTAVSLEMSDEPDFARARIFGESFKVITVDKSAVDFPGIISH